MKRPYLEVTFRKGRPVAAYLYLPRPSGVKSARTVEVRPTILVDYAVTGEPIGIELTAPTNVDAALVNTVLGEIGIGPLEPAELSPLRAA
jgi:uncharacterized protein YuzE